MSERAWDGAGIGDTESTLCNVGIGSQEGTQDRTHTASVKQPLL